MLNQHKLEVVSASSIQMFLTCRQKYWMRYGLGWVSKQKPRALEFGGAYDRAIETLHNGWDADAAILTFEQSYEDQPHDTKRTRATAQRMIRSYAMKYRDQPFTIVKNKFKFQLSVPEVPGVRIVGEIDRVIDWFGRHMVDELKTTSQLSADYMRRFWVDYQTTIYIIAARRLVEPGIVNVLADACLVSKTDPSKLRSQPFLRDVIEKDVEQLEYMRVRIVQIILDMKACHEADEAGHDVWYENDQSCTMWNGCTYLGKCKHPRSMHARILEADYKYEPRSLERFEGAGVGEFRV